MPAQIIRGVRVAGLCDSYRFAFSEQPFLLPLVILNEISIARYRTASTLLTVQIHTAVRAEPSAIVPAEIFAGEPQNEQIAKVCGQINIRAVRRQIDDTGIVHGLRIGDTSQDIQHGTRVEQHPREV